MTTANTSPIFPATPYANTANLAVVAACTTRGVIAQGSLVSAPCNAVQLSPPSVAGRRIDKIQVQAISTAIGATTAAQNVLIWMSDGTNAYVIDEIAVTAQLPSITAPAFQTFHTYTNLVLPSAFSLYASTTVATTAATTALAVTAFGGDY